MNNDLDYYEQKKVNEQAFNDAMQKVRPDFWALMQVVDETKVNMFILHKVARALTDIATDTKYGQVVIEIENGVARFVRGIKADRLNETVIKEENE